MPNTRTRRPADPEVKATSACVYALEPLDDDQRDRVVTYLSKRYGPTSGILVMLSDEVCKLKTDLKTTAASARASIEKVDQVLADTADETED